MASSGVTTFSVNELEIITAGLEEIRVVGVGRSLTAADQAMCRKRLNMIVKQWSSNSDFAPGMKMWTRKRAYVFLQKDQVVYSLGPSGDNTAADSYLTTTLSANASAGASSITVVSTSGITNGANIGILLDSGSFQWTTVNGSPGGTVPLTATLTGNASSGARVFVYTTKMRRPLEIITAVRRDTDDNDFDFDHRMIVEEYEGIPDKTAEGVPDRGYFEAQLTNAKLYINRAPEDVTDVLRLVYLSPIEDFTQATDTADFSQEWYRPLYLELAIEVAGAFGKAITPDLKMKRDEALAIARGAYPEVDRSSFQPNEDGCA